MNANIQTYFEKNWSKLRDKIKAHWNEFTDEDLAKIDGNYERFIAKLKKCYEYDREKVDKLLYQLLDDEGLIDLKYRAVDVWNNAVDMKNRVKNSLQRSTQLTKKKVGDVEESCGQYVKEHPIKSIGIALLVGSFAGKFILSKNK